MKCIIGLGNPGAQYADTRHNVGSWVVTALAKRNDIPLKRKRLRAIHGKGEIAGQGVLLAWPQTFMNNSGEAVRRLVAFYQIESPQELLVIYDDINLELGAMRIRRGGSEGGHRGLRSVIAHLGTQEIPRLRLGIGSPPPGVEAVDYVLSPFKASERKVAQELVERAAECVECYLQHGVEAAMNEFNG